MTTNEVKSTTEISAAQHEVRRYLQTPRPLKYFVLALDTAVVMIALQSQGDPGPGIGENHV